MVKSLINHKIGTRLLMWMLMVAFSCTLPHDRPNFVTKPTVELDLKAIQKRGELNVVLDNNSVSYFIYKGNPMGYEYELLQRLAKHLKVNLKIKVLSSIDEAFTLLNTGKTDIVAFPLSITSERKKYFSFTAPHYITTQVLVQNKQKNKRMETPFELVGQEVYVKKGSSFKSRLENLSEEIGGEIIVKEDTVDGETESLIQDVAEGRIKYTVADQTIAVVNSWYYPNLDISMPVSLPQQIGWALRKNSPDLLKATNAWLNAVKESSIYQVIYNKYFNSPRFSIITNTSDYSSLSGNKLSPYDDQIKEGAGILGWDWRLLASVVYQESNFDPSIKSWAGAVGLMQVMPETGEYFGIPNIEEPGQNIKAGVRFLKFLDGEWAKTVYDSAERVKFVLASYNVGLSHILDARNLANKYGRSPVKWDNNVEYMLGQKSNPKYYRDKVVVAGYCRCYGPIVYVKEVLNRYEEYKIHIE
jgi:membrane-bound lytic murein transglycosylase F